METLEEALEKIATLEAEVAGLKEEKQKLIGKRDELLGKLTKLKKYEKYETDGLDVEALVQFKEEAERNDLEAKGHYEELYKRDKEKLEQRIKEVEQREQEREQERQREKEEALQAKLQGDALLEYSKPEHGIFSPQQLWALTKGSIKYSEEGKPVYADGYKEMPLGEWVKELKEVPEYQNQFRATGATGTGSQPPNGSAGSTVKNPWLKEYWNMTEQGRILRSDRKKAEALAGQAGVTLPKA